MKRLRELRGVKTQKELATKLGISQRTYSNYENGNRQPDHNMLMKIATYFNVTVDYLLGRTDIINSIENKNLPTNKNLVTSIGRGGNRVTYEISDENAAIVDALLEQLGKKNES